MAVAALYDIHANLPALEAVLEDVRKISGVERILIGGDVLPGPMPRETLDRLHSLDIPTLFLYGNGEAAVLDELAGKKPNVPEQVRPVIRWAADQIDEEMRRFLKGWPPTQAISVDGLGHVLFCHATPRDDNEIFTRLTPEARLAPSFSGLSATVVACGHTHMQFDRMVGETRVVNAGSVGMPFGEPGADWLLLGPGIELRHTSYDLEAAATRVRRTRYPQAEDFAAHNILQPPSERQMLDLFSRIELR
jgi:predicted phosphodiesterase